MTKTDAARLRILENCLSAVAGVPVEITIRNVGRFTWSIEQRNESAADRLVAWMEDGGYAGAKVDVHHDDECGTFVYVDVPAPAH